MIKQQDPEDVLIRRLLIGAAAGALVMFLLVTLVITIMISANFNFLNWME